MGRIDKRRCGGFCPEGLHKCPGIQGHCTFREVQYGGSLPGEWQVDSCCYSIKGLEHRARGKDGKAVGNRVNGKGASC